MPVEPDLPRPGGAVRLYPLVPLTAREAASVALDVAPGLVRLHGPSGVRTWRTPGRSEGTGGAGGAGGGEGTGGTEPVDAVWWDEDDDTAVLVSRGTAVLALAGRDWGRRHLRAALDVLALPRTGPPDGAATRVADPRADWPVPRLSWLAVLTALGSLSPALAILLAGTARVLRTVVSPAAVDAYVTGAHVGWVLVCGLQLAWTWTTFSPVRPGRRPRGALVARGPFRPSAGRRVRLVRDGDRLVVGTADALHLRLPLVGPQRVGCVAARVDPAQPGGGAVVVGDTVGGTLAVLPVDPWWRGPEDARAAASRLARELDVPLRDPLPDPAAPVVGAVPDARHLRVVVPLLAPVYALTALVPLLRLDRSPLPWLTVAAAVLVLVSLVVVTVLRVEDLLRSRTTAPDPEGAGGPGDVADPFPREVDDPAVLGPEALPTHLTRPVGPGPVWLLAPAVVGAVGLVLADRAVSPAVPSSVPALGAALVVLACGALAVLLVVPVLGQERRRRRLLGYPGLLAVARPGGAWGPREVLLRVPGGLAEVDAAYGPLAGVRTGPGAAQHVVLPVPPPGERGDLLVTGRAGEVLLVLDGSRWFPDPAAVRAAADALVGCGLREAPDGGTPYPVPAAPGHEHVAAPVPGPSRAGHRPGRAGARAAGRLAGRVATAALTVAPVAAVGLVAVVAPVGGSLAWLVTASGTLVLAAAGVVVVHLAGDTLDRGDGRAGEQSAPRQQEVR
ncbi:hypothetical protein [Aquipuribacter sp. SD81]|uniref:hypothetical protein n=1 Tax=Aquipuribacter sp. SD81 TaxID=3127703 RepID=UPI003019CD75